MKTTNKVDKLVKFLKENDIEFTEGRRNSDSVIISGFCLHIELEDLDEIKKAIENNCEDAHWNFIEEFLRVYYFARSSNYGAFWETEEAKKLYKF